MINWIKFAPLKLRYSLEEGEFSAPSFESGRRIKLTMCGNKIIFKCPKHNSKTGGPPFVLRGQDCENRISQVPDRMANRNWLYTKGFYHSWDYNGEWFQGAQSTLAMSMMMFFRSENNAYKNISFFHPKSFELVLVHYLNASFGVANEKLVYKYSGPLSWQAVNDKPLFGAIFWIGDKYCFYVFPVSNSHFCVVRFFVIGTREDILVEIKELIHKIVASFSFDLGEETRQEIEKIKATGVDWGMPENFPPLDWPISKEDIEAPVVQNQEKLIQ